MVLLKTQEMYQQELDAIDKRCSTINSIDCMKAKFLAKIKVCKQWMEDLRKATTAADDSIDEIKVMIIRSKDNLRKSEDELQKLRQDLQYMQEELQNDDSGIGELLTIALNNEGDEIDFESRSTALSEFINNSSRELDQLAMEITKLDQAKADIKSQYTQLQHKFDQLEAEIRQEIDNCPCKKT